VFSKGAKALGEPLLPPSPQAPLDALRYLQRRSEWSDPLKKLDQPLWLALVHGVTRHLGIEYKLSVKINTRWGIAPSVTATPRELLTSFGMNPQEFSLYTVDGVEPLPADTPLSLQRGDCFEAQKDGKYGSTLVVSRALRGSQTIEDDIEAANGAGETARLVAVGSQKYVEVRDIGVPSPPWGNVRANILIAIPATYPSGGLDAFYVELPFTHSSGPIPNQQSTVSIDGRNWALISWHYHETRPWNPSQDDLTTHIQHCRGFFLKRGIRQ
jgi:E2/UBC family protein E